jgi:hypothetical protein
MILNSGLPQLDIARNEINQINDFEEVALPVLTGLAHN